MTPMPPPGQPDNSQQMQQQQPNILQQLLQFLMGRGALQQAAQQGSPNPGATPGALPTQPSSPAYDDPLAIQKMAAQQALLQKAQETLAKGKSKGKKK